MKVRFLLLLCTVPLWALPENPAVAAGSADIVQDAAHCQINQMSDKAIINWDSFSISPSESVTFSQPAASSVVLNRVVGQSPSQIFGRLSANGQVFLINPQGVLFAPGAMVDTAGLIVSTLALQDQQFLAGDYTFSGLGGSILNQGSLRGHVALVGGSVINEGAIEGGSLTMAAGAEVILSLNDDATLCATVSQEALDAYVSNKGQIHSGRALLTASSANAILETVVNNEGIIQATTLTAQSGRIILRGGAKGMTENSGTLAAKSVTINGRYVSQKGRIEAPGGTVFLGRDAERTYIDGNALIDVSHPTNDAGSIYVWSRTGTTVYGSLLARAPQGTGGFIETSAEKGLDLRGTIDCSGLVKGSWLIDPTDLSIVPGSAQTGSFSAPPITWTSNNNSDTLGVALLNSTLMTGNVIINASAGAGVGGGSITVTSGSGIVLPNNSSLTLTGSNNSTGFITFASGSSVALATGATSGNLVINGSEFINNGAPINLGTGNLTVTLSGVSTGSVVQLGGGTITCGSAAFSVPIGADIIQIPSSTGVLAASNNLTVTSANTFGTFSNPILTTLGASATASFTTSSTAIPTQGVWLKNTGVFHTSMITSASLGVGSQLGLLAPSIIVDASLGGATFLMRLQTTATGGTITTTATSNVLTGSSVNLSSGGDIGTASLPITSNSPTHFVNLPGNGYLNIVGSINTSNVFTSGSTSITGSNNVVSLQSTANIIVDNNINNADVGGIGIASNNFVLTAGSGTIDFSANPSQVTALSVTIAASGGITNTGTHGLVASTNGFIALSSTAGSIGPLNISLGATDTLSISLPSSHTATLTSSTAINSITTNTLTSGSRNINLTAPSFTLATIIGGSLGDLFTAWNIHSTVSAILPGSSTLTGASITMVSAGSIGTFTSTTNFSPVVTATPSVVGRLNLTIAAGSNLVISDTNASIASSQLTFAGITGSSNVVVEETVGSILLEALFPSTAPANLVLAAPNGNVTGSFAQATNLLVNGAFINLQTQISNLQVIATGNTFFTNNTGFTVTSLDFTGVTEAILTATTGNIVIGGSGTIGNVATNITLNAANLTTTGSILAGNNIVFHATGFIGPLNVLVGNTLTATAVGAINLISPDAALNTNQLSLSGSSITLTATALTIGGDLSSASPLTLTSTSGNIMGAGGILSAPEVILTSAGNIYPSVRTTTPTSNLGTRLNVNSASISYITETNNISVSNVTVSGGGIILTSLGMLTVDQGFGNPAFPLGLIAAGGNLVFTGPTANVTGSSIDLSASGSILNETSNTPMITTNGPISLNASTGTIGFAGAVITVSNPTRISASAFGEVGGISIDINGHVGDNTIHFPANVPGLVILNGVALNVPVFDEELYSSAVIYVYAFLQTLLKDFGEPGSFYRQWRIFRDLAGVHRLPYDFSNALVNDNGQPKIVARP